MPAPLPLSKAAGIISFCFSNNNANEDDSKRECTQKQTKLLSAYKTVCLLLTLI